MRITLPTLVILIAGCATQHDYTDSVHPTNREPAPIHSHNDTAEQAEEGPSREPGPTSDFPESSPLERITVDFIQKDIHTVLHYIALKSGLKVIVEGPIDFELTVAHVQKDPLEIIELICEQHDLVVQHDDGFVILRDPFAYTSVVESEADGRYDVKFRECDCVDAIMHAAYETRTPVFIEAERLDEDGEPRQVLWRRGRTLVTVTMKDATPSDIMGKLADLGEFQVVAEEMASGTGYRFTPKASWPIWERGQREPMPFGESMFGPWDVGPGQEKSAPRYRWLKRVEGESEDQPISPDRDD